MNYKNLVGLKVKKIRQQQGLSRVELAKRYTELGWNTSERTLSRIEDRSRTVVDFELLYLVAGLRVSVSDLCPPKGRLPRQKTIRRTVK